jgi:16S rRNA (uracil1498-N3)-methyltransferase
MELYFADPDNIHDSHATFDAFESQHILKTKRKKLGDLLNFTDGEGHFFEGIIVALKPALKVEYHLKEKNLSSDFKLTLAVGFIRQQRIDFFIEKGTELGIDRFYLFASNNTNYYTENTSRWQKIARQAIKQSLRYYLPSISTIISFKDLLEKSSAYNNKFIALQNSTNTMMDIIRDQSFKSGEDILFVIGPEGGFESFEIDLALKNNFIPITFGKYRLRTETAVLTAASYINLLRT